MSEITFFASSDINLATNNLSKSCRISKWKYGSVYKGWLNNNVVMIKILDSKVKQYANTEFLEEVNVLKEIRHPNLVNLIGACIESRALIYWPFPGKEIFHFFLSSPELLTWQIRTRMIRQLCSTFLFLYSLPHYYDIFIDETKFDPEHIGYLDENLHIKLLISSVSITVTNPTSHKGMFIEYIKTRHGTSGKGVRYLGIAILRLLTGLPDFYQVHNASNAFKALWTVGVEEYMARIPSSLEIKRFREDWVRDHVDKNAGDWPYEQVEMLAHYGSIFLRITGDTEKILDHLQILIASIDSFTDNKVLTHTTENKEKEETRSVKSVASSSRNIDRQNDSKLNGTTSSRCKRFSYMEIKTATNDFSESLKIGQGGFGSVYKCYLEDEEVAIKVLDTNSSQGLEEFIQEIDILGDISHPNIVRLIGECFRHRTLIYEFVPNGSLENCLVKRPEVLTWQIRTRIIFELCLVLNFLHSQKPQPMVHGDLKPDNILLDDNFSVKLADFGLSRFMPEGFNTPTVAFRYTKNINGTEGYMDPDYFVFGKLTPGCDVYSFGITIMRVLTGSSVVYLREKVKLGFKEKNLMTIVDSKAGDWPEEVVMFLASISLKCSTPTRMCSTLMTKIAEGLERFMAK